MPCAGRGEEAGWAAFVCSNVTSLHMNAAVTAQAESESTETRAEHSDLSTAS